MGRSLVKVCGVLAVGVFVLWGMGQGVAATGRSLDSEGGFRDAKIGAPLSSFRGLVKDRTYKGIDYYKRQGDNLSYGGVKLESILYGFSGGVLARIQLRTPTEKESSPGKNNTRFKALRRTVEAYSDVSLAAQSGPYPGDPLVNECLAETGPGDCAVFVYQARKIQVRLKAIEKERQEETSRRVLTAEQISAYLRQAGARLMSEGSRDKDLSAISEALLTVGKARLAKFQFQVEGARVYEGADGSITGVKEIQGGRFDVMTLKDVALCSYTVAFSLVPPPDDWAGKIVEEMEKEKGLERDQKKP